MMVGKEKEDGYEFVTCLAGILAASGICHAKKEKEKEKKIKREWLLAWISSLGYHHLDIITWISSLGYHHLDIITWISSLGYHHLDIITWISSITYKVATTISSHLPPTYGFPPNRFTYCI